MLRCVQAANTSLKAALAQQEAHVEELTAGKPSSATEVSASASSEQAAEHAQQVWCGLMSESRAFSPHERCGLGLLRCACIGDAGRLSLEQAIDRRCCHHVRELDFFLGVI